MSAVQNLEQVFEQACDALFGELRGDEALAVHFEGESSDFMRFNKAKVRQIGRIDRAEVDISYYSKGRTVMTGFEATGDAALDKAKAARVIGLARLQAELLPPDPYQSLPEASSRSREVFTGTMPDPDRLPETILKPGMRIQDAGAEFVGIHAQGPVCSGAATSAGARHWFATESFLTDYSACLPNGKAIKSCYAGREWRSDDYAAQLKAEAGSLAALMLPERSIPAGEYRAYLRPDAVNKFVSYLSGRALSERQMRRGECPFIALKEGRKSLSPLFNLTQDFSLGMEPRFDEAGDVAPEALTLIQSGKLVSTLVSSRTARQYGCASNAASAAENVRSVAVAPGSLDEKKALEALGTGLYLANLHYLNWSDMTSARVTGMTRYACFWVEDGRIVAPIKDMRFDDSLYHVFGDKLEALGAQPTPSMNPSMYRHRALGSSLVPGALLAGFRFTL